MGAEGDDGVGDEAEEAEPALFARVWKERKEALSTVLDLLALLVEKYKYCFTNTEEAENRHSSLACTKSSSIYWLYQYKSTNTALLIRRKQSGTLRSHAQLVKQYLYFCTSKASKSRRRKHNRHSSLACGKSAKI